jgi:hypothetical protein
VFANLVELVQRGSQRRRSGSAASGSGHTGAETLAGVHLREAGDQPRRQQNTPGILL